MDLEKEKRDGLRYHFFNCVSNNLRLAQQKLSEAGQVNNGKFSHFQKKVAEAEQAIADAKVAAEQWKKYG